MNWKKRKAACLGLLCAFSLALGGILPDNIQADEPAAGSDQVVLMDNPVQTAEAIPPETGNSNSPEDPVQTDQTSTNPDLGDQQVPADGVTSGPAGEVPANPTSNKKEPDSAACDDAAEPDSSEEVPGTIPGDEEELGRPIEFRVSTEKIDVLAKTSSIIIPEDAELRVKRVTENDLIDYQQAKSALLDKDVDYDSLMAFDISFFKDGVEIEPENGEVAIEALIHPDKEDNDQDLSTVKIHHMNEQQNNEAQEVASVKDKTIEKIGDDLKAKFSVDSFSIFTVSWQKNQNTKVKLDFDLYDDQGKPVEANAAPVSVSDTGKNKLENLAPEVKGYTYVRSEYNGTPATEVELTRQAPTLEEDASYSLTLSNSSKEIETHDLGNPEPEQVQTVQLKAVYQQAVVEIRFDANGGNKDASYLNHSYSPGEKITLPSDYDGTKTETVNGNVRNYVFEGWSPAPNPETLKDNKANYQPVYLPGDVYTVPAADSHITLYAVWAPVEDTGWNKEAVFYIRLDGIIPDEPGSHHGGLYSEGITVDHAIKKNYWLIDLNPGEVLPGLNYSKNGISLNLNGLPTNQQITDVLKKKGISFDPDKQYIHWYVQKYENSTNGYNVGIWHVDGVLMNRSLLSVSYDKNCDDNSVVVPAGYQKPINTIITVGKGKNDSEPFDPVRRGYVFEGWTLNKEGSGKVYQKNEGYTLEQSTTFFAKWTQRTLTIRKSVTGNFADKNREFEFQVDFYNADGAGIEESKRIKLKDGEEAVIEVPYTKYRVQELSNEYATSHSVDGGQVRTGKDTGQQIVSGTSAEVVFSNDKSGPVPTGFHFSSGTMLMVVLTAAAGYILISMNRAAKNREE